MLSLRCKGTNLVRQPRDLYFKGQAHLYGTSP